jgi:hypothetical protein
VGGFRSSRYRTLHYFTTFIETESSQMASIVTRLPRLPVSYDTSVGAMLGGTLRLMTFALRPQVNCNITSADQTSPSDQLRVTWLGYGSPARLMREPDG